MWLSLGLFNNCFKKNESEATLPFTQAALHKIDNTNQLIVGMAAIEIQIRKNWLSQDKIDALDRQLEQFTYNLRLINSSQSQVKNKQTEMDKCADELFEETSKILYQNQTSLLQTILAFAGGLIAHYLTGGLSLIPKAFCVAAGFVAGWYSNKPAYAMAQSFGFFQTEKRVVEYAYKVKKYYEDIARRNSGDSP